LIVNIFIFPPEFSKPQMGSGCFFKLPGWRSGKKLQKHFAGLTGEISRFKNLLCLLADGK